MFIPITPVAKPRMTQSDRWRQRDIVMRYRVFCDELRLKVGRHKFPDRVELIFYMPMPTSWSKKKKERMNGTPHKVRPDRDNLEKAVMDALIQKPDDDARVWEGHSAKYWSDEPGIEILPIE
jgi:Holliday junction resolvase RusA-like endonuclease